MCNTSVFACIMAAILTSFLSLTFSSSFLYINQFFLSNYDSYSSSVGGNISFFHLQLFLLHAVLSLNKTFHGIFFFLVVTFILFFAIKCILYNIKYPHVVCLLNFVVNAFSGLFSHACIFSIKDSLPV